jgi:hypothetical protein
VTRSIGAWLTWRLRYLFFRVIQLMLTTKHNSYELWALWRMQRMQLHSSQLRVERLLTMSKQLLRCG